MNISNNFFRQGYHLFVNFSITVFLLLGSMEGSAFQSDSAPSIFDLMNHQDVLKVTIETDLKAITSDNTSDEKYKSVLSFTDKNGALQTWDTKVSLRGKFRRSKCVEMPPLKLDFSKKDLAEAGLAPFDDMKLVTHCVEDRIIAKELLIKEYLAYKIYNQITPESFRVQFLEVTYKDLNSNRKKRQYAFLIEDTAQLRARIGAEKVKETMNQNAERFDHKQLQTMAVFQYMIGNADYSLLFSRNVKILLQNDKLIAIPYDFDFSGIVNPPYGISNPNYNQKNLRDRIYLGFDTDVIELEDTLREFKQQEDAIKEVVMNLDLLQKYKRKEIIKYLDTFFENETEIFFGINKI